MDEIKKKYTYRDISKKTVLLLKIISKQVGLTAVLLLCKYKQMGMILNHRTPDYMSL